MPKLLVHDLVDQYERTFRMLYADLDRFDERSWLLGPSPFLKPVSLAMHILDCLDYYFSGNDGEHYRWGHRFGGRWWTLKPESLPEREAILAYARDLEARIVGEIGALDDADLARPFPIGDGSGATVLGHHIYALRHTVHHHGELAALAVQATGDGGSWE